MSANLLSGTLMIAGRATSGKTSALTALLERVPLGIEVAVVAYYPLNLVRSHTYYALDKFMGAPGWLAEEIVLKHGEKVLVAIDEVNGAPPADLLYRLISKKVTVWFSIHCSGYGLSDAYRLLHRYLYATEQSQINWKAEKAILLTRGRPGDRPDIVQSATNVS